MSMLWQRVAGFFKAIWSSPFGQILSVATNNLVRVAGTTALDLLTVQAQRKVAELDLYSNMTGEVKARHARDFLIAYAESAGLNVAKSVINLVVELAVSALKVERS